MNDAPELHGFLTDIGHTISKSARAVYHKAGDAGDFVKRQASSAYDFAGDIKDVTYEWGGDIVDLPIDAASSLYEGIGDLKDDPMGALYRTGGRYIDNSLDVTKSVGSITKDVFQGNFYEAGKNLAVLQERSLNILPRGVDNIANVITISPITQNREILGSVGSIVLPLIGGIVISEIGDAISEINAPNIPSADIEKAKEPFSEGKSVYNEIDLNISNAKDNQREIEKRYSESSQALQAAKEDARNWQPNTQREIAQLKQELAESKSQVDKAAKALAISESPKDTKKALAEYQKAAAKFDSSLAKATGQESASGAGNLVIFVIAGVALYLFLKP